MTCQLLIQNEIRLNLAKLLWYSPGYQMFLHSSFHSFSVLWISRDYPALCFVMQWELWVNIKKSFSSLWIFIQGTRVVVLQTSHYKSSCCPAEPKWVKMTLHVFAHLQYDDTDCRRGLRAFVKNTITAQKPMICPVARSHRVVVSPSVGEESYISLPAPNTLHSTPPENTSNDTHTQGSWWGIRLRWKSCWWPTAPWNKVCGTL